MNAEEIVKAAMSCVERDCWHCIRRDNEPRTEDECRRDLLNQAADLIESLTAQLAEAREREKAAVGDWASAVENSNSLMSCDACLNRGYDECDGIFCKLKSCHPAWRGPQKGEGK